MPIYEYECPKCGRVFEEWGKAAESHREEPCPVCGTPSKRVMSRTSFVLKGDGWYVSDYGYRKGIKDDAGGKADVPLPAQPVAPAKQGDKSLAEKKSHIPAKADEVKPAKAPKKATSKKKAAKGADTAKTGGAAKTAPTPKTAASND